MNRILVVALGGACGAVARYWLGSLISARWPMQFPLGTYVINVTGSFIIGFFLTTIGERAAVHPNWRLLIAVGFVGAYTTFSTFEYETLKLIEEGRMLTAALNVILSVTVGLIAVWLGVVVARRFLLPPELTANLQNLVGRLGRFQNRSGE